VKSTWSLPWRSDREFGETAILGRQAITLMSLALLVATGLLLDLETSAFGSHGSRSRSAHAGSLAWICQVRLILDRPAGLRCASQGALRRHPRGAGSPSFPMS
jgi:hypothetical protein